MSTATAHPDLAARLRDAVVSVRHELSISRHRFRSGPAYVLRDPITFKTHRLDPEDYRVLSALDRTRTLGQTFDSLCERGILTSQDEQRFYEFIVSLHQRNLLVLPLSDGAVLYERFQRRRQAERLSRALGIFFLRVPLLNPDRFLTRTLPFASWLFTKPAVAAWFVLAVASLLVVFTRWNDLTAPVAAAFTGGNLVLLWATLIGLKVIHEFGHAYACKAFGGHVPEMGAYLVLFTPLAYVDATDAWSFTSTKQRVVVTVAGVYLESIVGIIALFVWATTGPSVLNTVAYQALLLATVTTLLFNMNPLLRYDAYYLVSDLAGVPNLRSRCEEVLAKVAKRAFFGLRSTTPDRWAWGSVGLLSFGVAQLSYRVVIMATIATVLVMKFGGLGIALAGVFLSLLIGRILLSLGRYVREAEELAGRRRRAACVVGACAMLVVGGVLLVPLSWPIAARGISSYEHIETIHAPSDGIVRETTGQVGLVYPAGSQILALENDAIDATARTVLADARVKQTETVRASLRSPGEAYDRLASEQAVAATLVDVQRDARALSISAAGPVRVLATFVDRPGIRVRRGDPLVQVGSGGAQAVLLLGPEHHERLRLRIGDELTCRSPSDPAARYTGTVIGISDASSRGLDAAVVKAAQSLSIAIDPTTGRAVAPYREIRIALDRDSTPPANATLVAQMPVRPMSTAAMARRRFAAFMNEINRGFSER
ncbi:MAG: hypothetical protein RIE77_11290 [Phycisphaerales bacterium]|jgi:putative peptide zinc metalloprotease protein